MADSRPSDKVGKKIRQQNISQIVGWTGYGRGGSFTLEKIKKDLKDNQVNLYDSEPIYLHNHPRFFRASLKEEPLVKILQDGLKNVISAWRMDKEAVLNILKQNEEVFETKITNLGFNSVSDFFIAVKDFMLKGTVDISIDDELITVSDLKENGGLSMEEAKEFIKTIKPGIKNLGELKNAGKVLTEFNRYIAELAQRGFAEEEVVQKYNNAVKAVEAFFKKYNRRKDSSTKFKNEKMSEADRKKAQGTTWADFVAANGESSDYRILGLLSQKNMNSGFLGIPDLLEPMLANAAGKVIEAAASKKGIKLGRAAEQIGSQGGIRSTSDIKILDAGVSIKTKALEQTKTNIVDSFFTDHPELGEINNVYSVINKDTVLNGAIKYVIYNAAALECKSEEEVKLIGKILSIASITERLLGYNKKEQIDSVTKTSEYSLQNLIQELPPFWMDQEGNCYSMRGVLDKLDNLLTDDGVFRKEGLRRVDRNVGNFSILGLPESEKGDIYGDKVKAIEELVNRKESITYRKLKELINPSLKNVNNMLKGHLSLRVEFDLSWLKTEAINVRQINK